MAGGILGIMEEGFCANCDALLDVVDRFNKAVFCSPECEQSTPRIEVSEERVE